MQVKKPTIVIGLSGKKGSGKSTVAGYLTARYGFKEYAFADNLKIVCKDVFQLSDRQLYGSPVDKETADAYWGVSPRIIMQTVGTAFRDMYQVVPQLENIWIRGLEQKIKKESAECVVISDVRYADEAEFVRSFSQGGTVAVIINVTRNGIKNEDLHESEQQAISFDSIVQNDGSILDLQSNVDHIIDTLMSV